MPKRSPGSLDQSPTIIVTPNFHLMEAWYEPGAPPRPHPPRAADSAIPPPAWAYFRLIPDPTAEDDALRKFPFVPPADGLLLFVARGAEPPWRWHRRAGFYLEIRSLRRQRLYARCGDDVIRRVMDTEALWSAYVAHREFTNHSGERSDVKIDWLADRLIDRAREDVERPR